MVGNLGTEATFDQKLQYVSYIANLAKHVYHGYVFNQANLYWFNWRFFLRFVFNYKQSLESVLASA